MTDIESPDQTSDPPESLAGQEPKAKPIRWWPAVTTPLITGTILAVFLLWPGIYPALRVIGSLATIAGGLISMLIWFVFFSRISTSIRAYGSAAVFSILLVLIALFRFDSFHADMWPIFTQRWLSTPEQLLAVHLANASQRPGEISLDSTPEDYPGFLGRDRLGVVRGVRLERNWTAHPPRKLWRHPIGRGWSSFAVVGNLAVTQEQRKEGESVVCYDFSTGVELWIHTDPEVLFTETMGGDGPRATPTIEGGKVYALGAKGILNCLETATGLEIWSRNILEDARTKNLHWGMSGSPLVVDDLVVVSPGGKEGYSMVAYNKNDGKIVWHSGNDKAAYCSPLLTTLAGRRQIVMLSAVGLAGYDIERGAQLWHYPWNFALGAKGILCAQPAALEGRDQVLMTCGYGIGSELVKIRREGDEYSVDRVWTSNRIRSKFSNMVVRDGSVYALSDHILTCLDLSTGKLRWKGGRYGQGQTLLVDDLFVVQAENGQVVLVEASPDEHLELGRFQALDDKTWNHPVLVGNRLLVRNDREAACYELPLVNADVMPTKKP